MAAIQLKKAPEPELQADQGYHLLALIQMKNGEWNRARRTLKKAARIDKTNTTTLRFLREVDEQTGVTTSLERKNRRFFPGSAGRAGRRKSGGRNACDSHRIQRAFKLPLFLTLLLGIAAGAAALWLLAVPAIRQSIYRRRTIRSSATVNLWQARGRTHQSAGRWAAERCHGRDPRSSWKTSRRKQRAMRR